MIACNGKAESGCIPLNVNTGFVLVEENEVIPVRKTIYGGLVHSDAGLLRNVLQAPDEAV